MLILRLRSDDSYKKKLANAEAMELGLEHKTPFCLYVCYFYHSHCQSRYIYIQYMDIYCTSTCIYHSYKCLQLTGSISV